MSLHLRTNSIAILGVLVLLTAAVRAQETPPGDEPDTLHVYHCNVPVRELAQVLQQVAGDRDVAIIPEIINNVLIVRGSEENLRGFDDLVAELNRPSPRLSFSLIVMEVDDSVGVEDADPAELLQRLMDENPNALIRRIRLSSLENQLAQVQLGEQRPVVSGASLGRDGRRVNNYQQEEFGTILTVTARVGEDGHVVSELTFEMSRLDDAVVPTDEAVDGLPPAKRTATLRSTVSAPDGGMVLLTDFNSQDNPGKTRLIGFFTASTDRPRQAASSANNRATQIELEASRYFAILDSDDDGSISEEEWERSVRIRGMFEEGGLDLSQPMSEEQFVENYMRFSTGRE